MGKSKKNKSSQNSGSNSNNVTKKVNTTKNEKKGKSEITKKEEVKSNDSVMKVESVLAVETVKAVNEEEERWDLIKVEEIDKQFSKAKIVTPQTKDENVPTSSSSNPKVVTDGKTSRITKQNYDNFNRNTKKSEEEFENFQKLLHPMGNIEYTKVVEINQDLFTMSKEYSLAHCVAEDLNMGSGIAVQFSNQFKRHGELANQRQRPGGVAILDFPSRFIYYLVTKKYSNGKPTLFTLWNSLTKMQKHVQENSVKLMAMPRIGCGLDRLEWSEVKFMIEHIFKETDVKITVCNFQQEEGGAVPRTVRKCRVTNAPYPVTDIEAGTMIIYFGTEDGFVDNSIKELDKKFRVLADYNRGPRTLQQVVRTEAFNGDYVLFGFIIKKTPKDTIDFVNVQKCAQEVQKYNRKLGRDCYQYLGLDVVDDPPKEEMQFHKILNILRSTLREVDVYVCYPKNLMYLMPRERSDY